MKNLGARGSVLTIFLIFLMQLRGLVLMLSSLLLSRVVLRRMLLSRMVLRRILV